MNKNPPATRTLRRVVVAAVATVSTAVVATAASDTATVLAIIHPMQPIGNIDCCH